MECSQSCPLSIGTMYSYYLVAIKIHNHSAFSLPYNMCMYMYMTFTCCLFVYRLTKKELCHSNEIWHALNSTFPDTNCIVSAQINPHSISTLGLSKVVRETFRDIQEQLTKGVLFHKDNVPVHKSVVAMAAVRECGFALVDHLPYSPDLAQSD